MRVIGAEAGGAFILAAMGKRRFMECVDIGASFGVQRHHGSIADRCGALVIGRDDPQAATLVAVGRIADFLFRIALAPIAQA